MSEKFGLGWKNEDFVRMNGFIIIMDELAKKQMAGNSEPLGTRHIR